MTDHKVSSDFYDLDAILALSSNIPCTVQKSIDNEFFTEMLGMKRPESMDEKGHKVEVPCWLVPAISDHSEVSLPKAFSHSMTGVLKADATHVNLERVQQHYYEFGMELCEVIKEQDVDTAIEVAHSIYDTFVQRIGGIIQKAIQGGKPEKLDQLEKKLFAECVDSNEQIQRFMGLSAEGSLAAKAKRKKT